MHISEYLLSLLFTGIAAGLIVFLFTPKKKKKEIKIDYQGYKIEEEPELDLVFMRKQQMWQDRNNQVLDEMKQTMIDGYNNLPITVLPFTKNILGDLVQSVKEHKENNLSLSNSIALENVDWSKPDVEATTKCTKTSLDWSIETEEEKKLREAKEFLDNLLNKKK